MGHGASDGLVNLARLTRRRILARGDSGASCPGPARALMVLAVLLAVTLVSCGSPPSSPQVVTQPSDTRAAPVILDPLIVAAQRFRRTFGLQSDDAYVQVVAQDPRSSSADFGIPLLPDELGVLRARVADARSIAATARAYGEGYASSFGGVYVDPETSIVMVLFTGDIELHRSDLLALLLPGSRFEVRAAPNALRELTALQDRLTAGRDWAKGIGLDLRSSEVDVATNSVSAMAGNTDPVLLLEATLHFQGEGMLTFIADPIAWLTDLPRGALVGQVVDAVGRPVREADLEVRALGAISDYEPDGGVAYGTRADGSFKLPKLAAMMWTITILRDRPGLAPEAIGSTRVHVIGGLTVSVRIVVSP